MTDWSPTHEWLDAVYARDVRPIIFGRSVSSDSPTLVMVGGQPAAGKSRAGEWAAAQHEHPMPEVTGDDLRYLHPDFTQLKEQTPMAMPNVTQTVSGPLVRRCLDEALARRYPLVLEGVYRDAAVTIATVERFAAAGFTVHAVAVAVPPPMSRASAVNRFITQGRWTPPSAHDSALAALPVTVEQLATHRDVARFTVVDRNGVLLDSNQLGTQRGQQAHTAIQHAHTRPLTGPEHREVAELRRTIAAAAEPGGRLFDLGRDVANRTRQWVEHGPPPAPAHDTAAAVAAAVSFPVSPTAAPRRRPSGQPSRPAQPGHSPGRDLGR